MMMNPPEAEPTKLVAVAVPLSLNNELSEEERISLNQLNRCLSRYDRYFVAPRGARNPDMNFRIKEFDKKYFGSAQAHNKLLLSPEFYRSFSDYEFLLIYHLDALVFSDQLEAWCQLDYDYIAPPWIHEVPGGSGKVLGRCGNGGFSLRKTESFLRVLNATKTTISNWKLWQLITIKRSRAEKMFMLPLLLLLFTPKLRKSILIKYGYTRNEDGFWADHAKYFYPDFTVSPAELALKFGFDKDPGYCFEMNNRVLPFGCHAWHKYDKSFWTGILHDQNRQSRKKRQAG